VTYDPGQLRIGRRLAIKILNASRFVVGIAAGQPAGGSETDEARPAAGGSESAAGRPAGDRRAVTEPLDQALLRRLADVVTKCTCAFGTYDHSRALERAEEFFWYFCDDYLELVKARAYGERGGPAAASAAGALRSALSVALRLFAPFLPFVTEEAWSAWQQGSVHRAAWPDPASLQALAGDTDPGMLDAASAAIAAVRKAKTEARVSMRTPARTLVVTAPDDHLALLAGAVEDVRAAGRLERIVLRPAQVPAPAHEVLL
jgi:valyl-tRNA synthetase